MGDLRPAPGQPGSDQLPFMAAFGNLIDCSCGSRHNRRCLARRAKAQHARALVEALRPEDIRWLNDHGWDGRFET